MLLLTVDNKSTLLTNLPKLFRKLFFAINEGNLLFCGFLRFYFIFSTKLIFRIRRKLFSQAFQLSPTERLTTFCSKCKNDKNPLNFSKTHFFRKKPGHKKLTYFDNRAHFVLSKGKKLTLKLPQEKEKQIFRKLVFPRMLQRTKQVHFWQVCQSFFSQTLFRSKYEKTKNSCKFQFFNKKNDFFGHVKWSVDNLTEFVFPEDRKLAPKVHEKK